MLILKEFSIQNFRVPLTPVEILNIGDIKLGTTTKNLFGKNRKEFPFVFRWAIKIEDCTETIYGESMQDCREKAIEAFREFMFKILR